MVHRLWALAGIATSLNAAPQPATLQGVFPAAVLPSCVMCRRKFPAEAASSRIGC